MCINLVNLNARPDTTYSGVYARDNAGGIIVSKTIAYAIALSGLAVTARAADLDAGSVKDPLPDSLTWNGVTLYGTLDVGYAYQNHGVPAGASFPQVLEYNIWNARNANKTISTLAADALSRTQIGVKIAEDLGAGWAAVGKAATDFSPLSGELSDGPASLLRNFGVPLAKQTANGDSNRAGQAFNGEVFAGLSNSSYGTLTVGRQRSFQYEAFDEYDPQGLSYAFGLIGYSAGFSGSGDTEAARWNNSVKYTYQYGRLHAGAMYADGGPDTGIFGQAYGFNLGGTYRGFAVDAIYQKENDVVSASAASATTLKALISDNQSWSVQGKYTFEPGGSFKDNAPGEKLTVFAGYENISFANPGSNPASFIGFTTVGGYRISAVTLNPYNTDKVLQVAWTGAKYELPSGWSLTGAYYHADQNAFFGTVSAPAAGTIQTKANAAGSYNDGSFVVDYQFNKYFDVYAGLNYSTLDGGLASGFLNSSQTTIATGVRLKF
jgi:predicted porin